MRIIPSHVEELSPGKESPLIQPDYPAAEVVIREEAFG